MKVIDGFKFGVGYILGQAVMVALAKGVIKACENGLKDMEDKAKENE